MASPTGIDLLMQTGAQMGLDQNSMNALKTQGSQLADQFNSEFQNYVGRAPTADETNQFYSQFLVPKATSGQFITVNQNPDQYIQSFLGNNFQQAANDTATQKLQAQSDQASSLADQFQSQGNTAINNTEQSLLNYQTTLFNQLRPSLITSLQSQGLLDTGGMNSAIAGVQGDLANQASNYVAQLQLNNQQQANQIRFGGASAPYYYQQGLISNQPNALNLAGTTGGSNVQNTFMSNLGYAQNLGLINAQANAQAGLQPSFLRTLGQSFGASLGNSGGQWFGPQAYSGSSGGTSGAAGMKSLFM